MATVRLTWVDPNSGPQQEDEVRVYRATAPFTADSLPTVLAVLPANSVTYDDNTVATETEYFYAVGMRKGAATALAFTSIIVEAEGMRFDPTKSSSELSFSASRRNFTYNAFETIGGAKTNYARRAGKFYFEVTIDGLTKSSSKNFASVGLIRPDYEMAMQAIDALGACVFLSGTTTGRFWVDGAIAVDLGVTAVGARYGFAVDLDAGLIWARRNNGNWNGSGTADPATGVGGLSLGDAAERDLTPASTVFFAGDQHTYRFAAVDLVDTAPAGFGVWLTATSGQNALGNTVLDSPKNANVTMSGGNLTATRTAPTAAARSRDYKTSGKHYFEFTANAWAGTGDCVGLHSPVATTANIVTNGTFGCYCYRNGAIWVNGASSGVSLGTVANGQRVDVAVDLDANLIWFRRAGGNWNNNVSADPATGVGGISFTFPTLAPCIGFGGTGGANGNNVTANLGASAFGGSVPSGFASGWTVQAQLAAAFVRSIWVGALS